MFMLSLWYRNFRWVLLPGKARSPRARRRDAAKPLRLEVLEARVVPSQLPHLLKDINPSPLNSNPAQFTPVGNATYFVANDGHGTELWKSDGTAAGTVLVKDINLGAAGSFPG